MSKNKLKRNSNIKKDPIKIAAIISLITASISIILGTYLLLANPMFSFNIRLAIILIIIFLFILALRLQLLFNKKKMKKSLIATTVFCFILTGFVGYLDYIFIRAINTLDIISVDTDDYITSYLYVLSDSAIDDTNDLNDKVIGLQTKNTVSTYQMIIDGLTDKGINEDNYEIEIYENYVVAYEALINQEVDAIALDESAISLLEDSGIDIKTKTKVIATFKMEQDNLVEANSVNISKEPFVALISGVDTRSGNLNEAANSDVIMLAAFNPTTMKLSLISIPRDSYLPVTCRGMTDKITHSGSGGISCTVASLEKAFNITINYYVKVNFYGVIDLVETLNGVEVDVPFSFCEQNAASLSDAICLGTGTQTLNGEQALALTRHRKTLPRGDIDRGANQQLVIQALIKKLASGKTVTSVDKLLTVLGNNIQTNMPESDMYGLFSLLTNISSSSVFGDGSALQMTSSTLSGYDKTMYTSWAGINLYYYIPYESSIKAVTSEINRILGKEDYPLPDDSFAFNANVSFDESTPYDPISNPSDKTPTKVVEDEPDATAVSILSSSSTYSHAIGSSIPSNATIMNTLGISAIDNNDTILNVTLSTNNVDWQKEGSYTITATAKSDGITETKNFTVLVYAQAKTESVTVSVTSSSYSHRIEDGTLSNENLISIFGAKAIDQNQNSLPISTSNSINWSVPGSYTVTFTASNSSGTMKDSKSVTLIITPGQTVDPNPVNTGNQTTP